MTNSESPLEVLTRAATMVESVTPNTSPLNSQSDKEIERKSPSFKERHPKFRKNMTPEYLMAAAVERTKRISVITTSYPPKASSPFSHSLEPELEGPLDMRVHKKDTKYSSSSSFSPSPPPYGLLRRSPPPPYRPPPSYHYSRRDPPPYESPKGSRLSKDPNKENKEYFDNRPVREITIITDSSADPLLDEHFRRSLGANYKALFKKSEESPKEIDRKNTKDAKAIDEEIEEDAEEEEDEEGCSVEDHFAKALGDTWIQLQQAQSESKSSQALTAA